MTEEELLTINPDAVWPGIEMYYAEKGKTGPAAHAVQRADPY